MYAWTTSLVVSIFTLFCISILIEDMHIDRSYFHHSFKSVISSLQKNHFYPILALNVFRNLYLLTILVDMQEHFFVTQHNGNLYV